VTKLDLNRIVCSLLILLVFVYPLKSIGAQQSPAKQTDQDEVIRVKTDLVQVRAVVTDKHGQLVDNLKQDDFEVLENGQLQRLSFFAVEQIAQTSSSGGVAQAAARVNNQPTATANAIARKPLRSIVLFVDTLHLSSLSLIRAKQQLKQFVDEQLTDEDLTAIVTTSDSLGLLGQFMRDRKMLKYAIDKITYFSRPTSFYTPYLAAKVLSSYDDSALAVATAIMSNEVNGAVETPPELVRGRAKEILGEEAVLRRSTLQTIKAVSEQMAEIPGQRMIAFMSDGFTVLSGGGGADTQEFSDATGRAARAGVVIYTFYPQGLTVPVESTAVSPFHSTALYPVFASLMAGTRIDQQNTLRYMAADTGGEAYLNSNDQVGQLKKMLDSNRTYYAMAYYPSDETDKNFRNLKVRIKNHPEYHVRTQRGYRPTTENKSAAAPTPQQKLFQAIIAPLPLTNISVTSSADYLERSGDDAQVTLRVHFAGDLLAYTPQEQRQLLNCEVAIVVFDHYGKAADSFSETVAAAFTPEQLEHARRNGYRYSKRLTLPPGLYQVRIGVRDANSQLMGTSMSWVDVPDLHKKKLTLSNIFLGKEKEGEQTPTVAAANRSAKPSLVVGQASFKRGEAIFYRFVLYNSATAAQLTGDLKLKVEILESGANAYDGSWQPLAPRIVRSDGIGLEVGGQLRMDVGPGIYTLRVTVKDPKSNKEVQQTIAFEIAS
jgi:VWFA-related protein